MENKKWKDCKCEIASDVFSQRKNCPIHKLSSPELKDRCEKCSTKWTMCECEFQREISTAKEEERTELIEKFKKKRLSIGGEMDYVSIREVAMYNQALNEVIGELEVLNRSK